MLKAAYCDHFWKVSTNQKYKIQQVLLSFDENDHMVQKWSH